MHRHLAHPIPNWLLATAGLLSLLAAGGLPALAKETPASTLNSALFSTANNRADQAQVISIVNAESGPIRALAIVHTSDQTLIGCSVHLLRAGESRLVYLVDGKATPEAAEDILTVHVLGFEATGSLLTNPKPRQGLHGSVIELDEVTAGTKSVTPMIAVDLPSATRRAALDECLTAGFGTSNELGADTTRVSSSAPESWSEDRSEGQPTTVRTSTRSTKR